MGSQEKVAQYVSETKRMGIRVLPPDINESYSDFTVVGDSIRFGLSAIKNVGTNVIESIERERKKNGKFENFVDFCERVDSTVLNKKTLESLIKSGTFDSMGLSRKYLLENYEKIIEEVLKIRRDRDLGQTSLFEVSGNEKEELILGDSFNLEDRFKEFSRKELLTFEKEMLGLYISGHPLFEYKNSLSVVTPVEALVEINDVTNVTVGGIITKVKVIYTKKDQQMCFVELEDVSDSVEVITFPSIFSKFREIIEEDKVVKIKGRLDKKEDQIKIIAAEFEEMEKDRKPDESQEEIAGINEEKRKVVFKVKKDDIDKDFINRFYNLVKKYPGFDEVEFRITHKNGKDIEKIYRLPRDCRIDLNESFEKSLREMFSDKISWDLV
jgi:DNA polymerase-3 subunit alpha